MNDGVSRANITMKEEFTAHDMATAAADGFRAGQRAAQSAPAGEREAFESWLRIKPCGAAHDLAWDAWKARAALAQSERVPEWIPVSERLPADSRDVLVYCSDTDEHMVGSSMGCGRFAFAFSERGTRICCKPSHWRYIEDSDKPAAPSPINGGE